MLIALVYVTSAPCIFSALHSAMASKARNHQPTMAKQLQSVTLTKTDSTKKWFTYSFNCNLLIMRKAEKNRKHMYIFVIVLCGNTIQQMREHVLCQPELTQGILTSYDCIDAYRSQAPKLLRMRTMWDKRPTNSVPSLLCWRPVSRWVDSS